MHKIVSLMISIVYIIGTLICTRNTLPTNKKHKYLVISLSFLVIVLNMVLFKPILEEITQESAESHESAESQKITQENAESQDLAGKSYNSIILEKYKGYYLYNDSIIKLL